MVLYASSYLYWAVFNACLIYALLNMCTRTRDEARESAFIAHKILQAKPFFLRDDDKQYNKIKSFTLQLLHQKNTFHFHGLGLFDLDYTFIFSVSINYNHTESSLAMICHSIIWAMVEFTYFSLFPDC